MLEEQQEEEAMEQAGLYRPKKLINGFIAEDDDPIIKTIPPKPPNNKEDDPDNLYLVLALPPNISNHPKIITKIRKKHLVVIIPEKWTVVPKEIPPNQLPVVDALKIVSKPYHIQLQPLAELELSNQDMKMIEAQLDKDRYNQPVAFTSRTLNKHE